MFKMQQQVTSTSDPAKQKELRDQIQKVDDELEELEAETAQVALEMAGEQPQSLRQVVKEHLIPLKEQDNLSHHQQEKEQGTQEQ